MTTLQGFKTHKSKVTVADLTKIQEHYYYLRLKYNQAAAENYLAEMRARGLLPQGLDDIQGGSN